MELQTTPTQLPPLAVYLDSLLEDLSRSLPEEDKQKALETCASKGEINKFILDYGQSLPFAPPGSISADERTKAEQDKNVQIGQYLYKLATQERIVERVLDKSSKEVRTLRHYQQQLAKLRGEPSLEEALDKCPSSSYWQFISTKDNVLDVMTKNNVVMAYKDEEKGIDLTLDLGKFLLSIDYNDLIVKISAYSDNTVVNGYYHPHISTRGTPCWGNVSHRVAKALAHKDIGALLGLTMSLLTSYNDGSAYVSYQKLWVARNPEALLGGERTKHFSGLGWVYTKGEYDAFVGKVIEVIEEGTKRERVKIEIYEEYSAEYMVVIPDSGKYFKRGDVFVQIDEGAFYGWC